MNKNIEEKTISKFAKYTSLSVLGMIGLSCYILADTFFVARGIGENGLAALNLAIPSYSLVMGLGLMIGIGGATRYAVMKSKTIFTNAVYMGILACIICIIAGAFFSDQIATILGADSVVLEDTSVYIKTVFYFSPLFVFNNIFLGFIRNDGNPRLAMIGTLSGCLVNVVMDYIMIYTFDLGLFGAALATGMSPLVGILILSTYFIRRKNTFHLVKIKPKLNEFATICKLGISSLITEIASAIVIVVFNILIYNIEGNTGVAAYGIIANISLVITSIFTGIAQGMQPLISSDFGRGNIEHVRKYRKYGLVTVLFLATIVYIGLFILAKPVVSIFNKDGGESLGNIAENGVRLYFTAFWFAGLNIVHATYLAAMEKAKGSFAISIMRGLVVILPITFLLSTIFKMNGIWLSMTVSEMIVFGISLFILKNVTEATMYKSNRFN